MIRIVIFIQIKCNCNKDYKILFVESQIKSISFSSSRHRLQMDPVVLFASSVVSCGKLAMEVQLQEVPTQIRRPEYTRFERTVELFRPR